MKTRIFRVIAAVSLITLFSCGKEDEPEVQPEDLIPEEQPSTVFTYSFSIEASKESDQPMSKALILEGNTLKAVWAVGEEVIVINDSKGEVLSGALLAQSDGASTTLKGELISTKGIDVNDRLTLRFRSPSYYSQAGTLEYIAANCDFAEAEVKVTSVDGGEIRTGTANFVNKQAIVKFTVKYPSGNPLANNAFNIKYFEAATGNPQEINVSLSTPTNAFYVAIPAVASSELIIRTKDSASRYYSYIKSSATFETGKYYDITVKTSERAIVYNEAELNQAVADNVSLIMLGCNIYLSAYLSIGETTSQTTTIDLRGYELFRTLIEADANGHVIEVHSRGNLTIEDSSGNNSGSITGGRANNGGGICNYGKVTIKGGTITDCKAAQQGGAIKNNDGASLTITGGVITGNSAPNGGGIYNIEGGTLDMSDGTISSNTASVDGGGIVNRGTATIDFVTIQNNTATSNGGAIWNSGTLTLGHAVTIKGNNALNGGGIYMKDGSNATLSGSTIRENTATVAGGILMDQNTVTSLTNCKITGNTATVYGGGGIVNYSDLTLNGSTITGNSCAMHGGGIWNDGTLNVQGALTVKDNSAEDLFLNGTSKINVTGALTSGANKIGISMDNPDFFTNGYTSSGTSTNPFFSNSINTVKKSGDEYKMAYAYYEYSWNGSALIRSIVEVPVTLEPVGDGILGGEDGTSLWFVFKDTVVRQEGLSLNYNTHFILLDGAQLSFGGTLAVERGVSLYIHSQSFGARMGKLVVTGADNCAAIGGGKNNPAGRIVIYGGDITANGGAEGAGIGGGDETSGFQEICICDGIVKATGGNLGAGIGYGDNNCDDASTYGGVINIYGGTVTATGGGKAAGIGGGEEVCCGPIYIYGGTITAQGGEYGAGIGRGAGDPYSNSNYVGGDSVTINGGTVTAKGGLKGAGIGSGNTAYGPSFTMVVNDGTISARGGDYAAGIGGGRGSSGFNDFRIYDGHISAYGGVDAAGIGSGEVPTLYNTSSGGTIYIYGGYVYAEGKDWGAGIGGGEDATGANVNIYGGTIEAKAGLQAAEKGGCAFGSENGGNDRGTITFYETYNSQTNYYKVSVGTSFSNLSPVNYQDRIEACWGNRYAKVELCTTHNYSGDTCTWCGHTK